jgi:DNA-binding winged helix-turn-helix (wHTH) protein
MSQPSPGLIPSPGLRSSGRSTGTYGVARYRFSEFTLSPQRRLLVQNGREVPLIPRYFDLLLLLIERRHEAVHRREIFERVWVDAVVSESALSQAVRTIRRALGDDSREPRFIRTVSRHGYRFVFPDVIEEADDDVAWPAVPLNGPSADPLVERERSRGSNGAPLNVADDEERLDDAQLRLRRAARLAANGATRAAAGAALAGIAAGGLGGLILAAAPGSTAPIAIAPVLAVIGGTCGVLGGTSVGAGLALAETASRSQPSHPSRRFLALTFAGALGGGLIGVAVQWLARWGLAALVGLDVGVGGGLEGVVIGGAAGLAFAIATRSAPDDEPAGQSGLSGQDGLAAGDGLVALHGWKRKRLRAALIIAVICGASGLALTLTGRPLAGGTIHAFANAASGSRATLAPLGRLIGEPDFGPVTSAILAFGETALFGLGIAIGLIRRRPSGGEEPDFRPV